MGSKVGRRDISEALYGEMIFGDELRDLILRQGGMGMG